MENLSSTSRAHVEKLDHPIETRNGGGEVRSRWITVTAPASQLTLQQSHPNPFNPSTRIRFSLPAEMPVRLTLFDVAGRKVRSLAAATLPAGAHDVVWDGRDDRGHSVGSGVYFYRLEAGSRILSRKMTLLE